MSSEHRIYAGVLVDVAEESIERAENLLWEVEGGGLRAVRNALTRAAASSRTVAARAVTKEYALTQREFQANTQNINHFVRDSAGDISVEFGFKGHVISLLKFDTKVRKDGRVYSRVKRSGAAKPLEHAFVARVGSHEGVFERTTSERFPVRELFGPATPQMMFANEAVMDTIEDKMVETYEVRIEHEITRLLNGWGR